MYEPSHVDMSEPRSNGSSYSQEPSSLVAVGSKLQALTSVQPHVLNVIKIVSELEHGVMKEYSPVSVIVIV